MQGLGNKRETKAKERNQEHGRKPYNDNSPNG